MANYKILVVDDEEDLFEILKFNLEVVGYDRRYGKFGRRSATNEPDRL